VAGKRITIVTAGHVSSCPRMLKAADALASAGHQVHVVSANHTPWLTAADASVFSVRPWTSRVVDYDASSGAALRRKTGVRFKVSQALASVIGADRAPMPIAIRAYSRAHDELVHAAASAPADLIYGGTTGALAAVAEAAQALRVPYGVDFEDLHSGERGGPGSELPNALAARVEREVLRSARFSTAASPMISDAYAERYGMRPLPIHNTFSIAPPPATGSEDGPLRLYWCSQTLGPGRGLEEIVRACGDAGVPIELHLRARPIPDYLAQLRAVRAAVAPNLELVEHEPAPPDAMVSLSQSYDAGLASEEPTTLNSQLCLSNKIFTYLAAGIPMLLSRTKAQARLEPQLGEAAFGYESGDVRRLAELIRELASDRALRCRARAAARDAAARRWHWEHPEDRGALVAAVEAALS